MELTFSVIHLILFLSGIVLTVITIRRMRKGQISLPNWAKILLSAAMILGLLITLMGILPPLEVTVTNPFVTTETQIVTPVDPSETAKASQ